VEVTKLLKPPVKRVALGDLASMQAAMKMNAEQAPKRFVSENVTVEFRYRSPLANEQWDVVFAKTFLDLT